MCRFKDECDVYDFKCDDVVIDQKPSCFESISEAPAPQQGGVSNSSVLLARHERIKTAQSCLHSQRAKDLFGGLAAIFTEAGVFWDIDDQRAQLEDDDITINVHG